MSLYQECGTWSMSPLTPLFEWTWKTAVQHGEFSTKSISPLEYAMLRVSDKSETHSPPMSVKREYAFSSGLMDLGFNIPALCCDYLSPLEYASSGLDGPSTSEVIL